MGLGDILRKSYTKKYKQSKPIQPAHGAYNFTPSRQQLQAQQQFQGPQPPQHTTFDPKKGANAAIAQQAGVFIINAADNKYVKNGAAMAVDKYVASQSRQQGGGH